jgi:hypothetical protein
MNKHRKATQQPAGSVLIPETSVPSQKPVEKLPRDPRTFCFGWEQNWNYVSFFQEREFGGNLA